MSEANTEARTPWQRVVAKFGLRPSELARELGVHRSKISVAIRDEQGLINGRDQVKLLDLAQKSKVRLLPSDLMPGVK